MNKRSLLFLLVILLVTVFGSGCLLATSGFQLAGSPSVHFGCYQVKFLGVTESSEVASTWRYRVQRRYCEQNLKSWMLELPACASVVDASPTPWGAIKADPKYQMSGIQWQTGQDFRDGEFSVVLTGNLETGITHAGTEAQDLSIGSLQGPACKGTATSTPPPTPEAPVAKVMAKVKVQSAYCRSEPRGKAKRISLLYRNQEAEILGRNEDANNPWWYVKLPDQNGNCWLWGRTSETSGDVSGLPIVK
jgi:hypothetical protein